MPTTDSIQPAPEDQPITASTEEATEAPHTETCMACSRQNAQTVLTVNGEYPICEECLPEHTCTECNSIYRYPEDYLGTTEESDDQPVCHDCSYLCDSCSSTHTGEPTHVDGESYCQECADQFETCQQCDSATSEYYMKNVKKTPTSLIERWCEACLINQSETIYVRTLDMHVPFDEENYTEVVWSSMAERESYTLEQRVIELYRQGKRLRTMQDIPEKFYIKEKVNNAFTIKADGSTLSLELCQKGHMVETDAVHRGENGYCIHCIKTRESIKRIKQNYGLGEEMLPEYAKIKSYHTSNVSSKPKQDMAKDRKQNNQMYFGIELETSFSSDHQSGMNGEARASKILEELKGTFVGERDATVQNGAELISVPMTYEYMVSKTMSARLEKAFEKMRTLGAVNGTDNRIGLHIHVSKAAFRSETKATIEMEDDMNWFVNCFQEYMEAISRRNATNYCKYPIQQVSKPRNASRIFVDKRSLQKGSHGFALNIQQQRTPTYEFRMFNSTQDYKQLMASVEFVRNLSLYAIEQPTIIGATFKDIVDYKKTKWLKEYVEDIVKNNKEKMQGWKSKKLKAEIEYK